MSENINEKKTDEQILKQGLKQGFKAGVTMACLSMGKFEKDEDTPKLEQFAERLYSEFLSIYGHKKDSNKKENE